MLLSFFKLRFTRTFHFLSVTLVVYFLKKMVIEVSWLQEGMLLGNKFLYNQMHHKLHVWDELKEKKKDVTFFMHDFRTKERNGLTLNARDWMISCHSMQNFFSVPFLLHSLPRHSKKRAIKSGYVWYWEWRWMGRVSKHFPTHEFLAKKYEAKKMIFQGTQ